MPMRTEAGTLESSAGLVAFEVSLIAGLVGLMVATARALPKRPPRGASRIIVPPRPPAKPTSAEAFAAAFEKCDPLGRGVLDVDACRIAMKVALPGFEHDSSVVTERMERAASGASNGQISKAVFMSVADELLKWQGEGRRRGSDANAAAGGVGAQTTFGVLLLEPLRRSTLGKLASRQVKVLRVLVPAAFSLVFVSWVVHSVWFGDATGYLPDSLEAKVDAALASIFDTVTSPGQGHARFAVACACIASLRVGWAARSHLVPRQPQQQQLPGVVARSDQSAPQTQTQASVTSTSAPSDGSTWLTVSILLMVPVYAWASALKLLLPGPHFDVERQLLDASKECYEAVVLHDFLALMYSMAGVSVGACGRLNGAPIPRGMKGRTVHFGWPMDLVLKESHFDEKLVRRLEAWTLQYVLVQPLLACLHLATHHYHASPSSSSSYEASGHYSDSHTHAHSSSSSDSSSSTWVGSLSAGMVQWVLSTDGEVWVSRFSAVASLVSTTLSLSALAGFYHTFQQELSKHAPLGKLLCIKAVVGICFWQAIVLPYLPQSVLQPWGGAAAFGDFLVALEMGLIFAFTFPAIYAPQPSDPKDPSSISPNIISPQPEERSKTKVD